MSDAPKPEERLEKLLETRLDERGTRRRFLKLLGTGAAAASCAEGASESFFQQHYQRLSDEDKRGIFERLERAVAERTGIQVVVGDPPPLEGVEFAFAISLSRCNGNRRCVYACMRENNQSRDPAIQYIRVIELDKGSLDLERGDRYFDHAEVPAKDKFYMPVQCMQCANPPCVKACPADALRYGDRDEMLQEARNRIAARPGKYVDHIYGEHEAGGTTVLYLSAVPFDKLGFPDVGTKSYPGLSSKALHAVPPAVMAIGAFLGGTYTFLKRRASGIARQQAEASHAVHHDHHLEFEPLQRLGAVETTRGEYRARLAAALRLRSPWQ